MGPTLFTYYFRRHLAVIGQFTAGLSAVAYLADFAEFSRRASTWPNYSVLGALNLSALRLPNIVQQVIPFMILFATMTAISALSRSNELTATRAAGASAWQFLAPFCLASFLTGVACVFFLNPLAASNLLTAENAEAFVAGKTPGDGKERVPWFKQRTEEGATMIGAEAIEEEGQLLSNAIFLRFDKAGNLVDRFNARSARLEQGSWHLTGVSRASRYRRQESLTSTSIKSYLSLDLLSVPPVPAERMPFYKIPNAIWNARALDLHPNSFAVQLYSLAALPFLLVAMTLIGAIASVRFARMGQSAPLIGAGVGTGFLLYTTSVLMRAFGIAGIVPPLVAASIPVLVALLVGISLLLYREDG